MKQKVNSYIALPHKACSSSYTKLMCFLACLSLG